MSHPGLRCLISARPVITPGGLASSSIPWGQGQPTDLGAHAFVSEGSCGDLL